MVVKPSEGPGGGEKVTVVLVPEPVPLNVKGLGVVTLATVTLAN
jgi:hypothetical protein